MKKEKKKTRRNTEEKSQNRQEEGKTDAPVQDWKLKTKRKFICFEKKWRKDLKEETLRLWNMAQAGRVFQRRIEKQRKDDRCRLEDANGNRNEWEDRRTISVLAWTVAGRSSDSDGGPWPLFRMYKRHRQWTLSLLLHASVGRLHFESTSGPGCPRCQWTMALATFSCAFSMASDFRDLADASHHTALQYFPPAFVVSQMAQVIIIGSAEALPILCVSDFCE